MEISVRSLTAAEALCRDFARLKVDASVAHRRGRWLVTLRTIVAVGDALTVIGAQTGRLAFEAGRVMGEMRAGVNRRINGETANLRRGVAASVGQVQAIASLRNQGRWDLLPPALREAGELRERHPDDTLESLAERAGCSRPAMAGRLHRLVGLVAVTLAADSGRTLTEGW